MLQQQYEERFDREKYIEELLVRIICGESDSTDAVIFYGRAGIGKSSLSKSLCKKITQYCSNSKVIEVEEILRGYLILNPVNAALLQLRESFLGNKSNLSCFDIAYLLYHVLGNTSEIIDLDLSLSEEVRVLPIIEIINQELDKFPRFLQKTKSFITYQVKYGGEAVLLGTHIFACLNWYFIQQNPKVRQWWKLRGYKDLQELKNCENLQDILKLLPSFLARDLQLYLQENCQTAVIFIDNYEYFSDFEGESNWLKDLIKLNPSIFWVIFAEKPVFLTDDTQNIPIPNLTDTECQSILQKFGIDSPQISQLIIEASGGIPLYLLLGAETFLTLAKYKKPQINDFGSNLEDILHQLNAAWDCYERRIWQILSNFDSWDERLFAKLMSQFDTASCDWVCECWRKLFNQVIKSPFVELKPEGVFGLHPIVGEYLYDNQPKNLQQSVNAWLCKYYQAEYNLEGLQNTLVKLLQPALKSKGQQQIIDWFLEQIALQQQAGKHLFTVAILQFLLKYQKNALASTLLGKSLFALGDYQQAIIALQTAKKLWSRVPNLLFLEEKNYIGCQSTEKIIEDTPTAIVELYLGACYLKLQRNSDADNAAKAALSIHINQFRDNSVEIAEVFQIQAEIALIDGYFSSALKLSQQALEIFESHPNIQFSKLTGTLPNFFRRKKFGMEPLTRSKFTTAYLNAMNKNFDLALKQLKQILDRLADETHPLAIYCHEIVGNIYQNMGYFTYKLAYEEYKLALEAAELSLGLTHPQTLKLITAIVNLSRIRGEYDTVDSFNQRRHANMEISHFEETPAVADRLNKIGCLLYQQGEYACSENLLQQALQINCKVLSEKHPQTAESFHNLGLIYKSQKRYYAAEVYLKQAVQIRSKVLGEKHPLAANSLNSLAALYCCMGRYQQAEPLFQQALEICQKHFGGMHPHTATTLNNLAQMYLCQGLSAKSEPIFQKALNICRQVLGDEHPYTKTVERNLNRLQDNL
ncbi:MAG: tetratricopeptide repeat protein [Cyanobacteria bacterium J06635_10]